MSSQNKEQQWPVAKPNACLGLLGGGQLGRMFCMAAQALGFRVMVLDPAATGPALEVASENIQADYVDDVGLSTLARHCVGVTTEFENVPAQALEALSASTFVSPSAFAVGVAQNRIREKSYIEQCGVPVVPHVALLSADQIIPSVVESFLPGILKTARLGYDGKGQVRVSSVDEVREAFQTLGNVECVLEKRVALLQEVSVIVARAHTGECTTFPVAENHHRNGILATTVAPARMDEQLANQARAYAMRIATSLEYVGVLCVEFFVVEGAGLIVNEIAPRPHNSGHYTMDACVSSQFEQQARVLARLPLGDTRQHSAAVMINLLGDLWFEPGQAQPREPNWSAVLALPEAKLHLYGKEEPRIGRKMGHITLVASQLDQALAAAQTVRVLLGIGQDDD